MSGNVKLFLTICFLFSFFSWGQSGLYAIKVNWSPNERHLVKLNPPNGQIIQPSSTSIFEWYVTPAGTTIDPNNNIYYAQGVDDPQSNQRQLYGIDLATGNVVSSALLPNSHEFHQMVFNCKDSSLYAIRVNWSPNERHLVRINPTTGGITMLSSTSIFEWYISSAETTIDPNNGIYYAQVTDSPQSNQRWLYGIDVNTGNVVSSALLPNSHEFHQIQFNCQDSSLYAIRVNWSPNERHLVKIEPTTGQITMISPTSIFEWYISSARTAIDPNNGIYYAQVTDSPQSNQWWLYGIDLNTGTVATSALLPNSHEMHQMVFNSKCTAPLDFLYQNTCIGNTTNFTSTACAGSIEWDFGDPASGNSNFSDVTNPTHIFSDTGYFDVKLKVSSCCSTDSIIKTIYVDSSSQIAALPNDSYICLNDTIILDASYLNGTYYWQDSSSTPFFEVTSPGVYSLSEVTCNTSDTIVLTYDSFQNFDLGPDTSLCVGSIVLDAGNFGGSYLWQDGGSNQQYIASAPGIYTVEVIDSLGCIESDTVELFPGSISVDLGNDTLICSGDQILLDATTPASTYLWQDGTASSVLSADTTGMYHVFVQSGFCSTADTVYLTVDAPSAGFIASDTTGCPPLFTSFLDQSTSMNGAIVDWLWNFGDNATSSLQHPIHEYSSSGLYPVELTITTDNGCVDQYLSTIEIEVYDQPTAQFSMLPYPATIGEQVVFTNESNTSTSWTWDFGDSTYSNDQNSAHIYSNAQEYTVQLITSNEHCSDTASQILIINEEKAYYIPNTFTPDGDEFNHTFHPVFTPGYELSAFTFRIINRRGRVIYESNDVNSSWDGTYKGKLVQDGTYIWTLEFTESTSDQQQFNTGHVNVFH